MKARGRLIGALWLAGVVLAACGDTTLREGDDALARQDFDAAIAAYRSALQADPSNVAIRYRLVDAYVKRINVKRSLGPLPLPELEQAVSEVHEIIQPVKDQERDLLVALVNLHFSLARNYGEANMPEQAREEWRTISQLQPTANAHYNIANASMLLGDWEGAIVEFEKALEMDEFLADAYKGLGNAYIQVRRDADAVDAYRKALDIEPLDTQTRYNLGIALKRTRQLDEAIAEFEKVIEQDPTYPLPYRGMRDTLEVQGDIEGALEWDRRFREVAGIDSYEPATAATEGPATAPTEDPATAPTDGAVAEAASGADADATAAEPIPPTPLAEERPAEDAGPEEEAI